MKLTQAIQRRGFLTLAAAAGAALATGADAAQGLLEASAVRAGDQVKLTWKGAKGPVSVFGSSDPYARPATSRRLLAGRHGSAATVDAAVRPRPYFQLVSGAASTWVAERKLPLVGGWNFRDIGGYRTSDGKQVKWGKIYRSGVMVDLTADDLDYLRSLGIQVICDLRSHEEREGAPNPFLTKPGPKVSAADYPFTQLDNKGSASPKDMTTVAGFVDGMSDSYVDMATRRLVGHFTDMFERLVAGDVPLAFNCTGGKDRTGTAAALILSVLGVPRATVVTDYGLTGVYLPRSETKRMVADGGQRLGLTPEAAASLEKLPPAVQDLTYRSDPIVMSEALRKIDVEFGGPIALAKQKYNLSDAKIAQLRRMYLV